MFGLKTLKRNVNQVFTKTPTVEEVHQAFDTAGENALKEAKSLLEKLGNSENEEKVKLLRKLGFINSIVVTKHDNSGAIRTTAEKRAAVVKKYQQAYPQYKFIFLDQVETLCQKYSLICAPIKMYKGDVPIKNLEEIEAFSVKDEDSYATDSKGFVDRLQFDFNKGHFITKARLRKMRDEENGKSLQYATFDQYAVLNRNIFGSYQSYSHHYLEVPKFICAPKNEILLGPNDTIEGVFAGKKLKDPIVLHYVDDGFLVVSKWGIEGKDPILTNEKMN